MNIILAAQNDESIAQCIRTILLTNKGDVPFLPSMGVGSHLLLDKSLDKMAMALEITNQINTYEPRVNVKQVLFMPTDTVGSVRIAIKYNNKITGIDAAYFHNN
ncbi:MAG: GPW/gp25 family protein [Chitinophagales bacterium]|nr:GPW/gp25 family protein [Chitinophagales bacterium]